MFFLVLYLKQGLELKKHHKQKKKNIYLLIFLVAQCHNKTGTVLFLVFTKPGIKVASVSIWVPAQKQYQQEPMVLRVELAVLFIAECNDTNRTNGCKYHSKQHYAILFLQKLIFSKTKACMR